MELCPHQMYTREANIGSATASCTPLQCCSVTAATTASSLPRGVANSATTMPATRH